MKPLLLIFILLFSIYQNSSRIVYYKSKPELYKIQLNPDSTFFYQVNGGFHLRYAEGSWKKINKNILLLKSRYLSLNNIPIEVIENQFNNRDTTIVVLECNIPDSDNFYSYGLVLDDSIIYSKDKIFKLFSKSDSTKIRFRVYFDCNNCLKTPLRDSIETQGYCINGKANYYKAILEVDSKYFYFEVINNDTLSIKGNKLIWAKKNLTLYKYTP